MSWAVARGIYRQGKIEPLDRISQREGIEVLVLFPQPRKQAEGAGVWQQIKEQIARELPDLVDMSIEESEREFDRLSAAIAEEMTSRSVDEFERAMRGDEYGLVGY